jgi:hypothetical protein
VHLSNESVKGIVAKHSLPALTKKSNIINQVYTLLQFHNVLSEIIAAVRSEHTMLNSFLKLANISVLHIKGISGKLRQCWTIRCKPTVF